MQNTSNVVDKLLNTMAFTIVLPVITFALSIVACDFINLLFSK